MVKSFTQPIYPKFTDRTKEWRDQLDSRWWIQDQYAECHGTIGIDRIERAFQRVFKLFDEKLAKRWQWHPFGMNVFGKGLSVLEFQLALGEDLLILDGSLRLPSVEADLRNPLDCHSARVELRLAAHLKALGHLPEFRPLLPNRKKSDFVVSSDPPVYFEVKRMQKSEHRLVVEEVAHMLSVALSNLVSDSDDPIVQAARFEVALEEVVTARLKRRLDRDAIAHEVVNNVVAAVGDRARTSLTEIQDFIIPETAKVRMGAGQNSVSYHLPRDESRRILRMIQEAPAQLHPDYPGIILVQSGEPLEPRDVHDIGQSLVKSRAAHLAAVVVFPAYSGFPTPFPLFRPFYILNEQSRYEARELKPFRDILTAFG